MYTFPSPLRSSVHFRHFLAAVCHRIALQPLHSILTATELLFSASLREPRRSQSDRWIPQRLLWLFDPNQTVRSSSPSCLISTSVGLEVPLLVYWGGPWSETFAALL